TTDALVLFPGNRRDGMGILYVARSAKLCRWGSDVGLGKHIYKVGLAEGDPKALAAAGWAGETDWTITRKQAVEGLVEDEAMPRGAAISVARRAGSSIEDNSGSVSLSGSPAK